MPGLSAVILAAGKGTRMKSDKAKVLHELLSRPMIHYVLEAVSELGVKEPVVVIGHQAGRVEQALAGFPCRFVYQAEQKGTGHAVRQAESALGGKSGNILIVCGDTPLLSSRTLRSLAAEENALLVTELEDPFGYGRIIRSPEGYVERVVEEKDADPAVKLIKEINAGAYCLNTRALFKALKEIGTDNRQGEYYLTDAVQILSDKGIKLKAVTTDDPQEIKGINDCQQLALAEEILRSRLSRIIRES